MKATSAWPSQAAITAAGTPLHLHRGTAGMPCVVQPDSGHTGRGDGVGPHLGQRVWVVRLPGFVAHHVIEVGVVDADFRPFGQLPLFAAFNSTSGDGTGRTCPQSARSTT